MPQLFPLTCVIPRIIHQTWKNREIPEPLREFQKSWLQQHPGWDYRLWDDADNERLITEHYPEFRDHYLRSMPPILKVDLVRLAYLHRFGGIYADLDCEALRPLDPLLAAGSIVVGRELKGIGRMMRGRDFIINALIISPPGHPLWLEIMRQMAAGYRPRRRFEPHPAHVIRMAVAVLDSAVEEYQTHHADITVMPHAAFYPAPSNERLVATRRRLAAACDSYVIHHYEDSWFSPLGKMVNAVQRIWQQCFARKS